MIVLRALARVISFLLLAALALVGLAVAVSSIGSGEDTLSLPWLADQAQLPFVRDEVGGFLDRLEAGGPGTTSAILGGLAAILLGLLLLAGVLVPRRERLVTLDSGGEGRLTARRRVLAQVARALVEQVRGVTQAKAKVRPRRRADGRIRVTADHSRRADPKDVRQAASAALQELTGPFELKARVRPQLGDRGSRVE